MTTDIADSFRYLSRPGGPPRRARSSCRSRRAGRSRRRTSRDAEGYGCEGCDQSAVAKAASEEAYDETAEEQAVTVMNDPLFDEIERLRERIKELQPYEVVSGEMWKARTAYEELEARAA